MVIVGFQCIPPVKPLLNPTHHLINHPSFITDMAHIHCKTCIFKWAMLKIKLFYIFPLPTCFYCSSHTSTSASSAPYWHSFYWGTVCTVYLFGISIGMTLPIIFIGLVFCFVFCFVFFNYYLVLYYINRPKTLRSHRGILDQDAEL